MPASQDKKLKDAPAGLPSKPVDLPKVDPSPEVVGSKDGVGLSRAPSWNQTVHD